MTKENGVSIKDRWGGGKFVDMQWKGMAWSGMEQNGMEGARTEQTLTPWQAVCTGWQCKSRDPGAQNFPHIWLVCIGAQCKPSQKVSKLSTCLRLFALLGVVEGAT